METQTFLDNFGTIAEAKDGVPLLRDLIVDLAVNGQLVGRTDRVEHEQVQLKDVALLISGQHLKPAEYNQTGDGIPYLTGPADFIGGGATASRWTSERRAVAVDGDVLVTVKGAGIGKLCVLGMPEAAISRQLMAVRPTQVTGGYLRLVLLSLRHQLRAAQVGIAIPGISRSDVLDAPISLPPRPIQERVVTKVDELMQQCDELEVCQQTHERLLARTCSSSLHALATAETEDDSLGAWTRLKANWEALTSHPDSIEELRQTVLRLAVRGKLSNQQSADEHADLLLQRIMLLKKSLPTKKRSNPAAESLPPQPLFRTPQGWAWARLGDLLSYCRNGISTKNNDEGQGFPLLRISAGTSRSDWMVDLDDHKFADLPENKASPYMLEPGDLLACRFNGNLRFVGMVSQVPTTVSVPVLHPDKLIRMKAIEVHHDYLRIALNADVVRAQIEELAATTAGNIGINGAQLQSLVVPVPPLEEQQRIAARSTELLAAVDLLQQSLTQRDSVWASLASSSTSSLLANPPD